jgi:hypothetical protein
VRAGKNARWANRLAGWPACLAALLVTLTGGFPSTAVADDVVQQECVGVATAAPRIEEADMTVQGRYTGIYSYEDSEFVKGQVDPLPSVCAGNFGRTLTYTLEIQSATNDGAWLRRRDEYLVMQPDPNPDPLSDETFSDVSVTTGISEIYAAHYLECLKHTRCSYHRTRRQLQRGAWHAVRKYRLYVCSQRSLRPPFLRGPHSTPGKTKARIRFNAEAIDLKTHQPAARKTYTEALSVKGAC